MFRLSTGKKIPCVGGDVARGERFSANVTVVGKVARGKALRRDGARPGDLLFVSGDLGGSALGLSRLLSRENGRGQAVRRHLFPEPRLALGRFLGGLRATAAMDLSDGLSMDLTRLAARSGVGAEIDAQAVPVFAGASLQQALHGGEEYEFLFTVRPAARVPKLGGRSSPDLHRANSSGKARAVEDRARYERLQPLGFEHF